MLTQPGALGLPARLQLVPPIAGWGLGRQRDLLPVPLPDDCRNCARKLLGQEPGLKGVQQSESPEEKNVTDERKVGSSRICRLYWLFC
jgi:hypothetical protein